MTALAFDFSYEEDTPPRGGLAAAGGTVRVRRDVVVPAPAPQPRLYAVRGTVVEAPASTHMSAVTAPPSLELLVGGAWGDLASGAAAACPVCDGTMEPRWTAGAGVAGGRCRDCGSTLDEPGSVHRAG